jgi:integrase
MILPVDISERIGLIEGHIHKRVHQRKDGRESVLWYVVVDVSRGPEGRRRQRWHGGFRTRREAQVARRTLVDRLNAGRHGQTPLITLAEWALDYWLPAVETRIKPTTLVSYRSCLDRYVLPAMGDQQVRDLEPSDLTRLYGRLIADGGVHGGLSVKSVRNVHAVLHRVLNDAVDAGVVERNVAMVAQPPRPSRVATRELGCWNASELARFLEATRGSRLEAIWRLAAMTGMRRGEILGLRWSDVDLEQERLSVRRAIVCVGYRAIDTTPKSHQARMIDLDAETVRLVAEFQELQRHERGDSDRRDPDRDLLVVAADGSPIHPQSFSALFQRIVELAGVRRIRLHELRHTHATLALQVGVPVKVISERLGHQSPAFTLKQYAHVLPGMQRDAAKRVAAAVARAET